MINVALIAENETVRESLQAVINLEPDCRWAGSWQATEEDLRSVSKLSPEVVLVDAQLEGATAVECTARLKRRLPLTRIIALLVYEDPEHIFRLLQAGACAYLLKRSNQRQIMGAIRNAREPVAGTPAVASRGGTQPPRKSPHLGS